MPPYAGFYTKLNVWGSLGLNFDYDGGPIIENGGPIFIYIYIIIGKPELLRNNLGIWDFNERYNQGPSWPRILGRRTSPSKNFREKFADECLPRTDDKGLSILYISSSENFKKLFD